MTFLTGKVQMLPGERETGPRGMIEVHRLPCSGRMASRAVRTRSGFRELAVMGIGMTFGTSRTRETKAHDGLAVPQLAGVAALAEQVAMRTAERKCGDIVIEAGDKPRIGVVASSATSVGNALVQLPAMGIVVTGLTIPFLPTEAMPPAALRSLIHMAAKTGYRGMGASQRETGCLVQCGFETGGSETGDIVTMLAIATFLPLRKLASMIIRVAQHAMRQVRILETRCAPTVMTFRTRHLVVPSKQREARGGVIDRALRQHDVLPPRWRMTGFAVLSESSAMMIFVAIQALRERDTFELRVCRVAIPDITIAFLRVAGGTCEGGMFALQCEARLVMVETVLLPVGRSVASATGRQLTPMLIGVARRALGGKTQVGFLLHSGGFFPNILRLDIPRLMTGPAVAIRVFAFKDKTGLRVLEVGRIPADQLEFPAVMLLVTGRALQFSREKMIPVSILDARSNFSVTLQAIVTKRLPAHIVAARAVRIPFEMLVRLREFARRGELGAQLRMREHDQQGQECERETGTGHLKNPGVTE